MAFDTSFLSYIPLFAQQSFGFGSNNNSVDNAFGGNIFGNWNGGQNIGIQPEDAYINPQTYEVGYNNPKPYGVNHDQPAQDVGSSNDRAISDAAITATVSSVAQGLAAYMRSRQQTSQYRTQASLAYGDAEAARINQRLAKVSIKNAYQSGEYEAMRNGLRWGQKIGQYRASTASRGVQMGSGSARQVEMGMRMAAMQDHYAIDRQMLINVQAEQNRLLQAQMAENTALANARAAEIMGGSNGGLGGVFALMQVGGNAFMKYSSVFQGNGLSMVR